MTKILVCDDHEGSAETMVKLLELYGLNAIPCSRPSAALELAREHKPNVGVIDLNLDNEITGYDVAKSLRDEFGNSMLLIAHTGKMDTDIEKCELAGFNEIIFKPTDFDILLSLIERKFSTSHSIQ